MAVAKKKKKRKLTIKQARIKLYHSLYPKNSDFAVMLAHIYPAKFANRVGGSIAKWTKIIQDGELDDLICEALDL